MVNKNNHLSKSGGVNKNGTERQQVATSLLPVLPAKTSALATSSSAITRANTGLSGAVANVAAVATCNATSLNSFFICYPRGQFAMSNKPHFLTDPVDPKGQAFRADCMAWELFTKKPVKEREAFIAGNPSLQTNEFRERLRRCEAWFLLRYCTAHQIGLSVAELASDDQEAMRRNLELMRMEMKKARQIKHKTYMGDLANA